MSQILPPRFLFRFAVPCQYVDGKWSSRGPSLEEEHRLPSFGELEGAPTLADVRVGWNEHGVAFLVRVEGKRHTPWCRATQLDASDGFHVWLDTRDTHNIHRASRFCHRFVFLPCGSGAQGEGPVAGQLTINRAKEQARPVKSGQLHVRSKIVAGGYTLEAFIDAEALTGYDPAEHPRLGFTYALTDRERGDQTFSAGKEFPYEENPSVWGTLELERAK